MRDPIQLGDITIRFLVEAGDSDGSMTMFEVELTNRAKVPAPHSHDGFDETIYGLTGTLTLTVAGEEVLLGPGEAMHIRRGVVHGFEALDGDASFLAVATPGVFGAGYFLELRDVVAAAAGGPPDMGALRAVMERHGLTPAGP